MLVARADVLAHLEEVASSGRSAVVVGAPGLGRSSVLAEAARLAGDRARRSGGLRLASEVRLLPCSWLVGRDLSDVSVDAALTALAQLPGPVFVDDLEDADAETVEVLSRAAAAVGTVVALRPGPLVDDFVLDGSELVELVPLSPAEAVELAGKLGASDPYAVARWSGGNPALVQAAVAAAPSPAHVIADVAASVRRLSPPAQILLATLASTDEDVPADDSPGLQELSATRFIEPGAGGRWRLRSGIAGEQALALLDPDTCSDIHRRLAALTTDPVRAVAHLQDAGDPARAAALAQAAAPREATPERRLALWSAAAAITAQPAHHLEAARAAVQAADHAAAAAHLGPLSTAADRDGEIVLRRAQAARLAGEEAKVITLLGSSPPLAGPFEALGWAERARAELVLEGDSSGPPPAADSPQVALVGVVSGVLAGGGDRADDVLGRLLAVAAQGCESNDRDVELSALAAAALVGGLLGCGGPLDVVCRLQERVTTVGAPSWRDAGPRLGSAARLHLEGNPAPLLDLLAGTTSDALGGAATAAHLALALAVTGRTGEATSLLANTTWPSGAVAFALRWWSTAEVAEVAGRLTTCRTAAARCVDEGPQHLPTATLAWLAGCRAALEAGDPLPRWRETPFLERPVRAEHSAMEQAAAGDPMAAAEGFATAADAWRSFSRLSELRCRWAGATAKLDAGDGAAAIAELRELDATATRLNLLPLAARVRRSLRRAGAPVEGPTTRRGERLSPRERAVLELVGRGMTSPEIAAHLGVARSTVETQIKAAVGKLGAKTRLQAAAAIGAA